MSLVLDDHSKSRTKKTRLTPRERRIIRLMIDEEPATLRKLRNDPRTRHIATRLLRCYRAEMLHGLRDALDDMNPAPRNRDENARGVGDRTRPDSSSPSCSAPERAAPSDSSGAAPPGGLPPGRSPLIAVGDESPNSDGSSPGSAKRRRRRLFAFEASKRIPVETARALPPRATAS